MKKLLFTIGLLLSLMWGCEKANENFMPTTIKFLTGVGYATSDTVLAMGETFKVGIEAENPEVNLTNFIIRIQGEQLETYLDSGMNTPKLRFERILTKGIQNNENWVFIIRDKKGKSAEINLKVTRDTASAFGDVRDFPFVVLGAQNNNQTGSFFSLEKDSTFTLNGGFQNQELIDLCYYYDFIDTDRNTIASPGANIDESVFPGNQGLINWALRRTSRFKNAEISETDFLNVSNDSLLIAVYGQSEGNRKAKNLQPGDIYSFKNDNGKVGLFRVNSLEGTDAGKVNISIKVQE
ncbi:MAG: hypothetical protein Q8O72_08550 [Bacteroidales bacterium]|nr:hypothetical protein [Bacteroidales bacterium]